MPRMDQAPSEKKLIKLLLIADGKVGKTRFAGMAAAAGFNVLYMDGDVGTPTLSQLPIEAKRNLYLLPMHDTMMGGSRDSRFIETFEQFSSNIRFRWNDTKSRMASAKDKTDEIWEIQPAQLDETCVLVLDSWTSFIESMMLRAAIAEGVDLADCKLTEMRDVYRASGLKATQMLQIVRALPCHVIVLAHPDEYEHRVAPDGKRVRDLNEKDMIIEWTKMIAKSTSRPHSLQMPKYFTDVAWMEVSPTGIRKLDFRAKASRISGGHFSDIKDAEEYSFANLVKEIGGLVPDPKKPASVDSWLTIIPPGEAEPVETKILGGGETGQVKMTSIFSGKSKAATASSVAS
jgi:hypothetical protein